MKFGTCHIIGCDSLATTTAAPNVHYCDRHAARDIERTGDYMSRMNGFPPTQDPFREIKNAGDGKIALANGRVLLVADSWPEVILVDETVPFGLGGRTTRISAGSLRDRILAAARA